jgi:hypothetical protein
MGLSDITESAVRKAMTEFDRIGRDRFLKKYRVGPAKTKFIVVADRRYDLKAIVAAAHGYTRPGGSPLAANDFVSGDTRIARLLRDLGFEIADNDDLSVSADREPQFDDPPDPATKRLSLAELRERAYAATNRTGVARQSTRNVYQRSQAVRDYVLRRAAGRCECCAKPAPFYREDGTPYLETHHIRQLSDRGLDQPSWVAGICPTCHRRIHHGGDGAEFNTTLQNLIAKNESKP